MSYVPQPELSAAEDQMAYERELDADDLVKTCVWPDGTECEFDEREEYLSWMSDDYQVVMK